YELPALAAEVVQNLFGRVHQDRCGQIFPFGHSPTISASARHAETDAFGGAAVMRENTTRRRLPTWLSQRTCTSCAERAAPAKPPRPRRPRWHSARGVGKCCSAK